MAASSSLVVIKRQSELAQVGKITDTANALPASSASTSVTDLDIEKQRLHSNAQLVGQAEAAPGRLGVHR
jgi:hypothetical protein